MLRIEIFRRARRFMVQFEQQPGLSKLEKAIESMGWTIIYYNEKGIDENRVIEKFKCIDAALTSNAFIYQNSAAKFIALYDDSSNKSKKHRLYHECGHIYLEHDFAKLTPRQERDAQIFASYCLHWTKIWHTITLSASILLSVLLISAIFILSQSAMSPTIQVVFPQYPSSENLVIRPDSFQENPVSMDENVYFTPAGRKYHKETCPYITGKPDMIEISLHDALEAGRTPCALCFSD